jgi:hypothetical protein
LVAKKIVGMSVPPACGPGLMLGPAATPMK